MGMEQGQRPRAEGRRAAPLHKRRKVCKGLLHRYAPGQGLLGQAGFLGQFRGQQGPAIHHPVKGIQHFPFRCGPQGGDLKQVVQPKGRGRCDSQGDIGFRPLHQPAIRQQIPLHPQDGLDLLAALGELVRRGHRVREGVDHPVVRDGDGPMAPTGRSGHGFLHVGEAVHGAHLGMQVQLHPLFRRRIHPLGHGKSPDVPHMDAHAPHEFVHGIIPLHQQPVPLLLGGFQLGLQLLPRLLRLDEQLAGQGIGMVADGKVDDKGAVFRLLHLQAGDLSADHHPAHILAYLVLGDPVLFLDALAVQHPGALFRPRLFGGLSFAPTRRFGSRLAKIRLFRQLQGL